MKTFATDDLYKTLYQSVPLYISVTKGVRLNIAMR